MNLNFRKSEFRKIMLGQIATILYATVYPYWLLSSPLYEDNITLTSMAISGYVLVIGLSLIGIRKATKFRKTALSLSAENLTYTFFHKPIEKETIERLELYHGHTKSYALIFLKEKPEIGFLNLYKRRLNKKHGTPLAIYLDQIDGGEASEVFQVLEDWKKAE